MAMIELAREIERSVNECLEDRVGIAFSGGLDSTIIATVARRMCDAELFSVGVKESEDLAYAEIVAGELGLPLHKRVLSASEVAEYYRKTEQAICGDFFKIEIIAPIYALSEAAAHRRINVLLLGSGCEELFVGYERYYAYWSEGKDLDAILREEFNSLKSREIAMIKKVAWKHGIEARFPFYSKNLAEMAFSIPLAVRMEDRELKKGVLREAAHFLGVPEIAVKRKKKALQYGTGVHKILLREFGQKAMATAAQNGG
ncbi:MAG: asparagine synthase-related protein [Candidatus Bilamarchaeaceae archaeon]